MFDKGIFNEYKMLLIRKIIILGVLLSPILASCFRDNENDLKQLHISGNVVKIETMSLTNIPIMEKLNGDPRHFIAYADGNYVLTFNRRGNIKRYQGFGIDNDTLFDVSPKQIERYVIPALFSKASKDAFFDSSSYELNENGEIVKMEYYKNDTLARRTFITYDSKHRPIMLVANSMYLGKIANEELFLRHDTTMYRYKKNDKYGNWTELEVERRCDFLPERNHAVYHVLRQITYLGDKKKPPLKNHSRSQITDHLTTHRLHPMQLGEIATINIPDYMVSTDMRTVKELMKITNRDSSIYDYDLCRYQYKDTNSYATFSVAYNASAGMDIDEWTEEDREFDEDIDEELRMQYEPSEINKDVVLLKWYPYSFVRINNHWALRQRFIRYGIGSWIPVYVESYMMDAPDGGAISIVMSYQINHRNYFHQDFINAIWSLRFL